MFTPLPIDKHFFCLDESNSRTNFYVSKGEQYAKQSLWESLTRLMVPSARFWKPRIEHKTGRDNSADISLAKLKKKLLRSRIYNVRGIPDGCVKRTPTEKKKKNEAIVIGSQFIQLGWQFHTCPKILDQYKTIRLIIQERESTLKRISSFW